MAKLLTHHTASDLAPQVDELTDTRKPMQLGLWVLGLGFGGFLLWASFAPLDEGVPTQGTVVIDTKRKPVQHLTGGLVREILVREGQVVEQGQVLAKLDSLTSRANLETARQTYQAQLKLIDSQRMQIKNIEGQVALVSQMLDGVRGLAEDGFAPRNQVLELEKQMATQRNSITGLQGDISRLEVESLATQERINALSEEFDRNILIAPVTGQVVGLMVQASGAVIQPGERLMDIVPLEQELLIETQVPPHLIDRIQMGQLTDVRFSAFSHEPMLVVEGRLKTISLDLVVENTQMGPMSFYLARLEITEEGLATLGRREMHAGMPAEVVIKTGERSLMVYLLHPLVKRIAASMTEE